MRLVPSPYYVPQEPEGRLNQYQSYAEAIAFYGCDYYRFNRNQNYEPPLTPPEDEDAQANYAEVNSVMSSNKRSRTSDSYASYSQDSKSARLEEWLFDSGATIHVTPNSTLLLNMYPCNRLVSVANGKQVQVKQAGDVLLRSVCGSYLFLKGVLYSPCFQKNIISAPLLVNKQDYIVIISKDTAQVRYEDTCLEMQYKATANLYFLKGERLPSIYFEYLELNHKDKNSRVLSNNLGLHVNLLNKKREPCSQTKSSSNGQKTVKTANTVEKIGMDEKPQNPSINYEIRSSNYWNSNVRVPNDITTLYNKNTNDGYGNIMRESHVNEISYNAGPRQVESLNIVPRHQNDDITVRTSNVKTPRQKVIDINDAHHMMGHMGEKALRNYLNHHNIKVTGNLMNCPSCMIWKAKNKAVNKEAINRATDPGERLHLDLTGPMGIPGNKTEYWVKIRDEYSGYSWNEFIPDKASTPLVLKKRL